MFKVGDVGFGDKVRIEHAEATIASGHAGRIGKCFGLTTPSATGVDIIGDPADDVALNVPFEDENVADAWFAPSLVALVEHPEGSRAVVGDQPFVMDAGGEWRAEEPSRDQPPRRRWFRRH